MENQILYTACVTPFKEGGKKVDYKSLEKVLKIQAEAENGIVLLGSTGEALSISLEEKKEMVEFACSLNLQTQVVVGVPNHNYEEAIEWLEFCNTIPVNGYLMATPLYTKPGIVGQTKWFEALLNKAKYPAILYNIPSRTGVRMHLQSVKNISSHPNFIALKECGGTVESFMEYKNAIPDIKIYCGDDYLLPALAAIGAGGLISIASNAWPYAFREHTLKELKGEKNQEYSNIFWKACLAMFSASNPIPIKALLKAKSIIACDDVRLPLVKEDYTSLSELKEYDELLMQLERK